MDLLRKFKAKVQSYTQVFEKSPLVGVTRIFFKDFTKNTSIHGFRYFSEEGLHWSERFWWLIALGLSLWLCFSMIRGVWIQWNEPIFDYSEKTHVSTLPFPTVTICPEIKILKHKFDVLSIHTKALKGISQLSGLEVTQLYALALVCKYLQITFDLRDELTRESMYKIIEDVAPSLEYTVKECWWQQKRFNCSDYMSPVLASQGLCFTFNGLNFNDTYSNEVISHALVSRNNRNLSRWSLDGGYKKPRTSEEYPVRALGSGRKKALELVLSSNAQDRGEFLCSVSRQGFLFFLTPPGESVELHSVQGFLQTELSENTIVTVEPKLTTTSKGLSSWKPMQRGCLFSHERRLRFFKLYTQHNCIMECLSNLTMKVCGCVGFYMPRAAGTPVCGAIKSKCYSEPRVDLRLNVESPLIRECNCLPSCTSIEYEARADRANLFTTTVEQHSDFQMNSSTEQQIRLAIFYNSEVVAIKKRKELYTFGEFLAICGGLFGLFMGVSLMSIIELFYYTTIRLFWIVRRPRSEENDKQSDRRDNDAIQFDGNSSIDQNGMRQKLFHFLVKTRKFLNDFCENSNMHGFRYFSQRNLHWIKLWFWLIAFGASMWVCGSMTRNVWIQWAEDPMTMSSTDKLVNAETIPFPTVTICPEIKATKDKLDVAAALNSLSNLSDIE